MEVKSAKDINDWHLVLFHEENFMSQFADGGKVFVDIGAHVGAWTLKLGKFFDKVVAFEPHPDAFRVLNENIALNDMKNVTCENCAVGSVNGTTGLTLYEHSSHSTLFDHHPMESHCGPVKGTVMVKMIRLDDYHFDDVSLIKIDVEGFEVKVIEGALETIRKFKPRLIVEIHSPENEAKVRSLLPEISFVTKSNGTQPYLVSE